MNYKPLYLVLAAFGLIIPYSQFLPFLIENGLDLALFVEFMFINRIASFFVLDVIVSAVVLFIFVFEKKDKIKHVWLPIVGTWTVGVSFGLPLVLYLRNDE